MQVTVKDSTVSPSAQLFFRADISDSLIEDNVIVGDNSRIKKSKICKYVSVDRNNLVMNTTVGRYSYTGPFDMIFNAKIGAFCSISYGVTIGPPEHDFNRFTTHPFLYNSRFGLLSEDEVLPITKFDKPCEIGNDVWIGCNVTILRGVKIGDGAVVGANALVNKDVPPYAIVAGVPARVIKYRFPDDVIKRLIQLKWWDWNDKAISQNSHLLRADVTLENIDKMILSDE